MATKNKDAVEFVKRWIDKGDEKQHSQLFWTDLLSNVLHSTVNNETVKFEYRVQLGHQSYIDVYLPDSRVIIEQKGSDIDLFKAAKQSDGTELTPFEQAKRYNVELPFSQKARWIVLKITKVIRQYHAKLIRMIRILYLKFRIILKRFLTRLESESVKELILALSQTVEGDVTASYIASMAKKHDITVSRIATGVPLG